MAKKNNYSQLAQEVVAAVGQKENIQSVTNCMTRLRFVLKDDCIPNEEEIKAIPGVKGVMNKGGQYQVIIGTHVNEVIKEVENIIGVQTESMPSRENEGSLFDRFFKMISGCIMPIIGPMIAGGIIKGLLTLAVTFELIAKTDGVYLVLYAASDAVLYFMPIIVGFSAGKVFRCNPYVTAAIGAALVYPDLVAAVNGEQALNFLGLPIEAATYSSTLFPIILASYVASWIERIAKSIIPQMLQLMLVPTLVLMITVPLSWLAIGPVMNIVSSVLSDFVVGVFDFSPIIGGILFGAFWQVMVLLGLHAAFIPVLINNIVTMGSDPINAILGLTVWELAGVSLGYALKMKDPEKKSIGFGAMASCLCGVTEPTIYTIALPQIKCFAAAWIGGGLAGGILGGLGARLYAMVGDGFFRIPGMINPDGLDISFYGFIACALIAFVVSAVLSYVLANREA
ncbi:PTS system beta-glucosides-specific IIC component [Breznakia blatticola]|uniref:PTS system beta-glucosides-specific IIC component n=1 Tax=Breznakia blatticola TaxID=1754012 RepID=A0A4V3G7W1_9FIRM|nr:PTS transporter subunit EIIC [Breznakia blatticola]TDW20604.1 PTS system beta-glucosides-specific IIC component [Breznakia blatticola]